MNELTIIENFNGNPVEFHSGDAFVNLTSMCAPFGKRPQALLNLEQTMDFMDELEKVNDSQPIIHTKSGCGGGTWVHPDLGLECARWLNPALAIWCNEIILKILAGQLQTAPVLREYTKIEMLEMLL